MAKLTRLHLVQLQTAILNGYDRNNLRMMLRSQLDVTLEEITSEDNYKVAVFTLIEWAERNGKVLDLVRAASDENKSPELVALANQAPFWTEIKIEIGLAEDLGHSLPPLGPIWKQIGIEMVKIPAGEFIFGNDKTLVSLEEFYLSRTPVTNRQFRVFINQTGYTSLLKTFEDPQALSERENHPVVNIDWFDALRFCDWSGTFLPSEQQWEKAARGTDGREYPWGCEAPSSLLCNYSRSVGGTTPVGSYSPQGDSPYELVDMAGNVWEWCDNWFDNEKKFRAVRGGSFNDVEISLRCSYRGKNGPRNRYVHQGFRVMSPRV